MNLIYRDGVEVEVLRGGKTAYEWYCVEVALCRRVEEDIDTNLQFIQSLQTSVSVNSFSLRSD